MNNNFGAEKAFIRTADMPADVGVQVGNLSLARTNLRGHKARSDGSLEGPELTTDLMAFLRMVRRQFWFILLVTLVITFASLMIIMSLNREYTATTLVILDEHNARLLEPSVANTLAADGEVEILKSDSLALQALKRLGLDRDPTFLPKPSLVGQYMSDFTDALTRSFQQEDDDFGKSTNSVTTTSLGGTVANGNLKPELVDSSLAKALRVFMNKVTVRRRGLTDVIAIEVTDTDPQRAAQYSNTYAEVYLEEQVATKLRSIEQAESGLSRRLAEIDDELKRSETRIGLRQVYQDNLQRMKAISQQRDAVGPDARIASQARPPDLPSFPNRKLLLLLASVGGFGLAVSAAYLRDLQTRRLQTKDEIEMISGMPVIASLPKLSEAKLRHASMVSDIIMEKPDSPFSEAIRNLLFTLQAIVKRGRRLGVILVTSADESEGKSTLAVSLARSAAIAGAKTVIVDCNLRNPEIHDLLNIQNEVGLVDLLTQTSRQHAVLQQDPRSGCLAIASGHVDSVSPEWLLRTEQIREVLKKLASEYDVVVLDAPPVGRYADSLLFTNIADLVLFAVRSGMTRPDAFKASIAQLQRCSDVDIFPILTIHTT